MRKLKNLSNEVSGVFRGALLSVGLVALLGCIKDAPLNPEADIEKFELPDAVLTSNTFIDNANNKIIYSL